MVGETYTRYKASDRSYFALLKKDIRKEAVKAGMDAHRLDNLDLILAEMTSNLHKYGKDGEILVGVIDDAESNYFELICLDHGSGIRDTEKMIGDGNTTERSMGIGLGSIKRLSDHFEIFSMRGWGTVILSRLVIPRIRTHPNLPILIRPMVIKMPGEAVSGDGTYYKFDDNFFHLLVADGLGHGPLAQDAVQSAVHAFAICRKRSPSDIIRSLHDAIRKTRGIVATVATLDMDAKQWHLAGVGNIATKFSNYLNTKSVMSYNGIIGHAIPTTIHNQVIKTEDFQQVFFCSDGITSQWNPQKLPGIWRHDLSIQAAAIYKDYARHTDDMSVVIAKTI